MKKILALFVVFFTFLSQAHAAEINKMVFFGDSLSDNGNIYKLFMHVLPKSPPYFQGRFSNGPTWAELVGKHFYDKKYVDYQIYAYGGATTVFHVPTSKLVSPMTLELEVDYYLVQTLLQDRSKTLVSIWIGGNDYFLDTGDENEKATDKVVSKIYAVVERLHYYGIKNFLILNLPDLGVIPYAVTNQVSEKLHDLSVMHNKKLAVAIKSLLKNHDDIKIHTFNIFNMLNEVMVNPEEYNKKFKTHITNINDACWQGPAFLNQAIYQGELTRDLQRAYTAKNKRPLSEQDAQLMGKFIVNTPDLANAYSVGKAYEHGLIPCAEPNDHIYWDHIHPTGIVHEILSQLVIDVLDPHIV